MYHSQPKTKKKHAFHGCWHCQNKTNSSQTWDPGLCHETLAKIRQTCGDIVPDVNKRLPCAEVLFVSICTAHILRALEGIVELRRQIQYFLHVPPMSMQSKSTFWLGYPRACVLDAKDICNWKPALQSWPVHPIFSVPVNSTQMLCNMCHGIGNQYPVTRTENVHFTPALINITSGLFVQSWCYAGKKEN